MTADVCRSRHKGDPESVAAYEDSRGHHQRDRDEILSILAREFDLTGDEYAARTGRAAHQVSGRYTELARDGLIVPSGNRRPTRTGSLAKAWRLRREGEPPFSKRKSRASRPAKRTPTSKPAEAGHLF